MYTHTHTHVATFGDRSVVNITYIYICLELLHRRECLILFFISQFSQFSVDSGCSSLCICVSETESIKSFTPHERRSN